MNTATQYQKKINVIFYVFIFLMAMGQVGSLAAEPGSNNKKAKPAKQCTYKNFDKHCKKIKAQRHKKVSYGCTGKYKGKKLYKISKTSCGICPGDYVRNPVQKKSGPKACFIPIGVGGDGKFSPMASKVASKCRKGQFKHKGYCKSCPKGTKRKHVAGLDTGYCKVLGYKKSKK